MKVLFVCLGNICRSPMAEAIYNHKTKRMPGFSADSCGTEAYHVGDKPDYRTIKVLKQHKMVTPHLGRQLDKSDFEKFDIIFAMDNSNLHDILQAGGEACSEKIELIREYDPQGVGEVPDPYYGSEKDFEEVYQMLERSIDEFLWGWLRKPDDFYCQDGTTST